MIAYRVRVITQVRERYERWEQRHRGRFAGWSVRRRWVVLVLVPTLVVCCGGTVVGVPVAWFTRATIEAGRGAKSPDAAADGYLGALGYNQQDGLLPLLDDQGELLDQWKAYRAEMDSTDPQPSKLDYGPMTVGPVKDGRAEVTADVGATWWPAGGGFEGGYSSTLREWRFQTRDDDGWRVTAVEAPAWCGGYVLASKCRPR